MSIEIQYNDPKTESTVQRTSEATFAAPTGYAPLVEKWRASAKKKMEQYINHPTSIRSKVALWEAAVYETCALELEAHSAPDQRPGGK